MKINLLSAIAATSVLFITQFLSCRKPDSGINRYERFDITSAKEWWYGTYRKMPSYKQVDYNSLFSPRVVDENAAYKYPSWKKGDCYGIGNLQIVELPLVYNNPIIIFPGSFRYSEAEKKRVAAASLQKLLLAKKLDGTIRVRTVTIIPSPEYAKENNYDISRNTLKDPDPNFTGWIVVKGWNETVINFWEIRKGKRVNKLKAGPILTAARLSTFTCYEDPYVESTSALCVGNTCGDEPCENEGCDNWIITINIGTQLTCEYTEGEEDPWGDCMLGGTTEVCVCEVFGLCDEGDPCELYGIDCESGGDDPPSEIRNNVDDPCISDVVVDAISADCQNKINNIIQTTFNSSDNLDLFFEDAALPVSIDGQTACSAGMTSGYVKLTITLNGTTLPTASKEYIVVTIYHEAIHAWIDYTNTSSNSSNNASHETMAIPANINMLAASLIEVCPNISLQDAVDLAWGGLQGTAAWTALSQADKDRIIQTNTQYKNKVKGTSCTP